MPWGEGRAGGARVLPGGPSEDENTHNAVCLSRPPPSPSRASSRPCLWPWTSSLRTERSSRRACDLHPRPRSRGAHSEEATGFSHRSGHPGNRRARG